MRRYSPRRFWLSVTSLVAAVALAAAAGMLLWGSSYVHNTVRSQLAAQQISFPPVAAFAHPKAQLASTVSSVFKGETLRSMLLNAYGWWKVSQITYIISLVVFGLSGLALAGSVFGFATGRKTRTAAPIKHESITPAEAA